MAESPLAHYRDLFENLRVDKSNGADAPHKPIMLLTIISAIEQGRLQENRIQPEDWIAQGFKEVWKEKASESGFDPNPALPFWHLKGPSKKVRFWHLRLKEGSTLTEFDSVNRWNKIKSDVEYAYMNELLWQLLSEETSRNELKAVLHSCIQ